MKKIFNNKYIVTILIVAIAAYLFWYFTKENRGGVSLSNTTIVPFNPNNVTSGSMPVDQAFCNQPEIYVAYNVIVLLVEVVRALLMCYTGVARMQ